MENLFLTKAQQRDIAYQIYDNLSWEDGSSKASFEYSIDENITLSIEAHAEAEGYEENDYFNGTGAWVTTYALCTIDDIAAFTDSDELFVVYDSQYIERLVENDIIH